VIFALYVLMHPVMALLLVAAEAWAHACMYGLSRSLARRLFTYALTWSVVGAMPITVIWSMS
jgi:hypothetical protein